MNYYEVRYRWGNHRGTMRLHAQDGDQARAYAEERLLPEAPGARRPKIRQFDVTLLDDDTLWDMEPGQEVP